MGYTSEGGTKSGNTFHGKGPCGGGGLGGGEADTRGGIEEARGSQGME